MAEGYDQDDIAIVEDIVNEQSERGTPAAASATTDAPPTLPGDPKEQISPELREIMLKAARPLDEMGISQIERDILFFVVHLANNLWSLLTSLSLDKLYIHLDADHRTEFQKFKESIDGELPKILLSDQRGRVYETLGKLTKNTQNEKEASAATTSTEQTQEQESVPPGPSLRKIAGKNVQVLDEIDELVDPAYGFTNTTLLRELFSKERCEAAGLPHFKVEAFVNDLCTVTDACCSIRQGMMGHYINASYNKKNQLDRDYNDKLTKMQVETDEYIATQTVQRCLEGDDLEDFTEVVLKDCAQKKEKYFKEHREAIEKVEAEATRQISQIIQRASMSEWEFAIPTKVEDPSLKTMKEDKDSAASDTASAATSAEQASTSSASASSSSTNKIRLNFNEIRTLLTEETMLPMIRSPPLNVLIKMYAVCINTLPTLREAYQAQLAKFKEAQKEVEQNKTKGGDVAKGTRNAKMLKVAKQLIKLHESLIFGWTVLKYIRIVLAPVTLTHYRWLRTKPWEQMTKHGEDGGPATPERPEMEKLKSIITSGGLLAENLDERFDFGLPGPFVADVWFVKVLLTNCPWLTMGTEFRSMYQGMYDRTLTLDQMAAILERIEDRLIDGFAAKRVQIVDNALQRPEKKEQRENERQQNEAKPNSLTIEMNWEGSTANFASPSVGSGTD